jgi:hypothetical protein
MRKFIWSFVSVLCLLAIMTVPGDAQPPQIINYQGILLDEWGSPVTDTVKMIFAIYDVSEGGTPLWSETLDAVSVEDGKYSVILGKTVPIALTKSKPYWLGITVGDDTEMEPRIEMTSVMYSLFPGGLPGPQVLQGRKANKARQARKVRTPTSPATTTKIAMWIAATAR